MISSRYLIRKGQFGVVRRDARRNNVHFPRWLSSSASPSPASPAASTVTEDTETDTTLTEATLRPSEVVKGLDRHIVGQTDAKRAVAIAMRNRWRRQQLPEDLRKEVTPRNVLLVGPTGCGKTEVARRMAMLNDAPFIKCEATKFTEVGYHGRDVDQIIRDLMDVSMNLTKKRYTTKLKQQAQKLAENRLLDLLTGPTTEEPSSFSRNRESFRDMLQQGALDDQDVEVDVPLRDRSSNDLSSMQSGSNPSLAQFKEILGASKKNKTERKKLSIAEARPILEEVELNNLLDTIDLRKEAITAVEESGIVFLDEIDKICTSREMAGGRNTDASADGVQRDLLPLIEGTTISTKYGNVNTDYILFVASGAFHSVKPSDLLPELQGRLPIRVELKGLTEDDLYRILTEPVANLVRQQVELLGTEGVQLEFDDSGIREIARFAAQLNKSVENIGARRLHTVMERIMEELSFEAAEMDKGTVLKVDKELIEKRMESVFKKTDNERHLKYIL